MSNSFSLPETQLIEFAKKIELAATQVLEGYHKSKRGGQGVEFHSALPYSDGEDTRFIDWNRYAATDRYYINKSEREERAGWVILIDSSSSMAYGEKAQWARLWAGAFVFLANVWGDRWRIYPGLEFSMPDAFDVLSRGEGGIKNFVTTDLHGESTDRLLILSDFFMDEDQMQRVIGDWAHEFRSVHLLQVLDQREIDFEFKGVIEFRDMESRDRLTLDSRSEKKKYKAALEGLQNNLMRLAREPSFYMPLHVGAQKLELQLLEFFERL